MTRQILIGAVAILTMTAAIGCGENRDRENGRDDETTAVTEGADARQAPESEDEEMEGVREESEDREGVREDEEGEEADASGETEVEVEDLPAAVFNAFRSAYPEARILAASREQADGAQVYEIESMDGTTRRDLVYGADGIVRTLEERIDPETLPAAVRSALEDGDRIAQAERVVEGDRSFFEIVVERVGRQVTMELDSSGQPVSSH